MAYTLVNEAKKQRAIKILKDQARARGENMATFEVKEEEVKALYEKFGGLVIEKEEGDEEKTEEVVEAPRRRSHRA